jgi:hypothetical protein
LLWAKNFEVSSDNKAVTHYFQTTVKLPFTKQQLINIMKKEFSIFLQFVLVLQSAGWGYFVFLLIQNKTTLALWVEHRELILNWTLAFTVLSFFRLVAFYIFSTNRTSAFSPSERFDLFLKEVSKTIQYCLFALISALISYEIFIFRFDPRANINETWLNFQNMFFAWLIGFFILSLLRLGVVYSINHQNRRV